MRTKEEIDQEYANLCLEYGDISQKIIHLERQEKDALSSLDLQKDKVKQEISQATIPLNRRTRDIMVRWQALQSELKDLAVDGAQG